MTIYILNFWSIRLALFVFFIIIFKSFSFALRPSNNNERAELCCYVKRKSRRFFLFWNTVMAKHVLCVLNEMDKFFVEKWKLYLNEKEIWIWMFKSMTRIEWVYLFHNMRFEFISIKHRNEILLISGGLNEEFFIKCLGFFTRFFLILKREIKILLN